MARLYIASYFGNASMIELTVRPLAECRGFDVCSTWHVGARGPEMLEQKTEPQIQRINDTNDADLEAADAVLVISHEKAAQTWCELARAVWLGKVVAVNTCARDLPEAHRPRVARFSSTPDALTWLAGQLRDCQQTRDEEPNFRAVFRPSSPPDTMPARADEDDREELGKCEICAKVIRVGDDHSYETEDGCLFCESCTKVLDAEHARQLAAGGCR